MQDLVAALFRWAYGIWPSYGPAVVLASLVISAFLVPFAVLEVRWQWKVLAQAGGRAGRDDPIWRPWVYRDLVRGRRLTSNRNWPVIRHSVIPALFVLVYAVVGTKPLGSRTAHLVGAALIALLVPEAVVLYLLTVLLVTACAVRLMALAVTFARSMGARENRHDRAGATRWADYPMPAELRQAGILSLWGGWLGCLLGVVAAVAAGLYVLTALPGDPRDFSLGFDTEPLLVGSLVGTAGMYVFARGENRRWWGQIMLSRINAYRHEHGF